jgi:hypothetical protein
MLTQLHEADVYTIVDASPGPEKRSRKNAPGLAVGGRGRAATRPGPADLLVDR